MPKLKPNDVPLTPEENAAVIAGIAADPDTFEADEEWFARARPAAEVAPHLVERHLKQSDKSSAEDAEPAATAPIDERNRAVSEGTTA